MQISFPWNVDTLTIPSSQKWQNSDLTGSSGTNEGQNFWWSPPQPQSYSTVCLHNSDASKPAYRFYTHTSKTIKKKQKNHPHKEIVFLIPYKKKPTHTGLARKWKIVCIHEMWLTNSLWLETCEQQVQSAEDLLYERLYCLFRMFWQKAVQTCQALKAQEDLESLFHKQILTPAFGMFTAAVFYRTLHAMSSVQYQTFFFLASLIRRTINRYKVNAWRNKTLDVLVLLSSSSSSEWWCFFFFCFLAKCDWLVWDSSISSSSTRSYLALIVLVKDRSVS